MTDVRLLAFYLPQFHPIPENDAWWGKGFTEWRNVARARPLFAGHHQPHIPADLGFYDLRLPETRQAQADLARDYGIAGFCYYHYWFNGKLLLERPIQEVLASRQPDFPFCLCWANENWSRRWDGSEHDILIGQVYSPEDDVRHIRYLIPYFQDPRYVRVHGKPVFMVYRIDELPDPWATVQRWRAEAAAAGLPGLYLCHVISSGVVDSNPVQYGLDAAVEFQPDWRNLPPLLVPKRRRFLARSADDEVYRIHGLRSYPALVERMLQRPEPDHKVFPCVTPGWDNSARRRSNAYIFIDSSPQLYQKWLISAIRQAQRRFAGEERLVFVNAWNEWAEGNHLEPDLKWQHTYLEATRAALRAAAADLPSDERIDHALENTHTNPP